MNLDPLLQHAAEVFGVHRRVLLSRSHERPVVYARFAVIFVARTNIGLSLMTIARAFGRKDHSSVQSGFFRAREIMGRDSAFAGRVKLLAEFASLHFVPGPIIERVTATIPADPTETRRLRVIKRMLARLERLAVENPQGFDQMMLRWESHDPANHL